MGLGTLGNDEMEYVYWITEFYLLQAHIAPLVNVIIVDIIEVTGISYSSAHWLVCLWSTGNQTGQTGTSTSSMNSWSLWWVSWWVDLLPPWGLAPSVHVGSPRFHLFPVTNNDWNDISTSKARSLLGGGRSLYTELRAILVQSRISGWFCTTLHIYI